MKPRGNTLARTLAIRMVLAALSVSFGLLAFFVLRYGLDRPTLRHATIESEAHAIATTLAAGSNPALLPQYVRYPRAYAFRVYDRRLVPGRKILAEANVTLLDPPARAAGAPASPGDLSEQMLEAMNPLDALGSGDRWTLTSRERVAGRRYWIQVVMVGDPARRWGGVLLDEVLTHVVVPVLAIVPALTLAMFLATRNALMPLHRISQGAAALGQAVTRGQRLVPLPSQELAREFGDVVMALNAMLTTVQRSLEQQRAFASDAAHELRTPLSVMRLKLDELPHGPEVDWLHEELAGLAALVGDLLRFAQAEEVMAADRRPVDVGAIARGVCEQAAALAVKRGQMLEFDEPERRLMTQGHPALIDAAVRNVVENALKQSLPDSVVSVRVSPGGCVVVDDRGPGVPAGIREKIFDRLWRADKKRRDGAGIGLALVRRIAQLHGGDVWVEDRAGGGARFVIAFGADAVEATDIPAAAVSVGSALRA